MKQAKDKGFMLFQKMENPPKQNNSCEFAVIWKEQCKPSANLASILPVGINSGRAEAVLKLLRHWRI